MKNAGTLRIEKEEERGREGRKEEKGRVGG